MSEWPMVKLGELLKPSPKKAAGELDAPILSITMHDGLVEQGTRFKKRIASLDTSIYRIVFKGQLVVGFPIDEGVLDFQDKYSQALVSPAYGVWDLVSDEVTPEFLGLFLKSPRAISIYKSRLRGTTARRRSLPTKVFQEIEFPLPPLGEQKRIAEILGEVSKAVELVSCQLEILDHGLKTKMWNDADESSHVSLDHYIQKITSGKSLKEGDSEDYQNFVLKISAVTTGYFNEMEVKPLPKSYDPPESHRANNGDILLSRANTTELVGASALVETSATNLFLPDKLWKLQLKDQVNAYFFWHLLQTKIVRSSISKASSGSGGSMKNISQKAFLAISVPEFSNEVQNQIGNIVREQRALRHLLHRKLSLLQELQKSLATRAFAGLL